MLRLSPIKYGVKDTSDIDPYAANVVSLCHFDSFNGDTSPVVDVVTSTGYWRTSDSPYITNAQSKFGGTSQNSQLSPNYGFLLGKVLNNVTWATVTPYTSEGWFYYVDEDNRNDNIWFNLHYNSDAICLHELVILATSRVITVSGSHWSLTNTGVVMPQNVWTHIAISSDGTNHYLYLNGVMIASGTGANVTTGTVYWEPNRSQRGGTMFTGYMDETRLTYGINRYPNGTTFTPPTQAFPNP